MPCYDNQEYFSFVDTSDINYGFIETKTESSSSKKSSSSSNAVVQKSVANQRKRDRNRKLNAAFEELSKVVDSNEKATKKEILSKAIQKIENLVAELNELIYQKNKASETGELEDYKPVYKRGQSEFQPVTSKICHDEQ